MSVMRLVHLSDLHFGDQPPALARVLAAAIGQVGPALVVVSGDLTQRARREQFLEARAWLDALDRPVLVVPGNHDLPLLALWKRLLRPRRGFRRHVEDNLRPSWQQGEVLVQGVDSTRRWRWKAGRAGAWTPQRSAGLVRVLVAHHPVALSPRRPRSFLPDADVVLAGHDHAGRVELLAAPGRPATVLQVVAGTALSRRTRGESRSFFLLDVHVDRARDRDSPVLRLAVQRWRQAEQAFLPADTQVFEKALIGADAGWCERESSPRPV